MTSKLIKLVKVKAIMKALKGTEIPDSGSLGDGKKDG